MANRLQKTLNPNVEIASVGSPPPQRDSTTGILQGVSQSVGAVQDIVGSVKKKNLKVELGKLGEEVSAIDQGDDLKDATDRFKRLKRAKDQGVLDDGRINIEAEAILKQKIGINQAFAPELRKAAADILGFDPTGSSLQRLFGRDGKQSKSRAMTAGEKRRAKAEDFARLGLGEADDLERLIAKGELGQTQIDIASQQAKFGELGSDQLLNASLSNIDSFVSDSIGNMMIDIKSGGLNPKDSNLRVNTLIASKEEAWNRHRKALGNAGIALTASKLSEQRKIFDSKFDPIIEMYKDDATMESLLTKQSRTMTAQASITGFDLFPGIAAINSGAGQAGVQEYFRLSGSIQDPSQLELIKRINPGFAAIADSKEQATRAFRGSYNRIMGLEVDPADPVISTLDETVSRDMTKNTVDPDIRTRNLEYLKSRGQSFKDFGDYAQSGARANVTQEEVSYVKERWGVEFEPLVSRISIEVGKDEDIDLSVTNGVLKATVSPLVTNSKRVGNFSVDTSIPSTLQNDIKRINAMNKMLNNGWSKDIGENGFGFLERTLNRVGTINSSTEKPNEPDAFSNAFNSWKQSPTSDNLEVMRKVDPEFVAEYELQLSKQRGGGSNGK